MDAATTAIRQIEALGDAHAKLYWQTFEELMEDYTEEEDDAR